MKNVFEQLVQEKYRQVYFLENTQTHNEHDQSKISRAPAHYNPWHVCSVVICAWRQDNAWRSPSACHLRAGPGMGGLAPPLIKNKVCEKQSA